MSILIPIELASDAAAAATLFGNTSVTANATVNSYLPAARIIGTTTLIGLLGQERPATGTINGSTSLRARVRLNDEPADVLDASIAGATTFNPNLAVARPAACIFTGSTRINASVQTSAQAADSVLLYVTVYAGDLPRIARYRPRLVVGSNTLPVVAFDYSQPANALGAQARLEVAAGAPVAGSASLLLDRWNGSGWDQHALISGGAIAEQARTIEFGGDRLALTITDAVNEQLLRAPQQPAIYYDPTLVQIDPSANRVIYTDTGDAIITAIHAVPGLDFWTLLDAVRIQCGFSTAKTNIPNFPVDSVQFSMQRSWLAQLLEVAAAFDPLVRCDGNALWVIDTSAPVPSSLAGNVIEYGPDDYEILDETVNEPRQTSGLVVQFTDISGAITVSERIEQDRPMTAGQFGDPAYTEQSITCRIREWRDGTGRIIREELVEQVEETRVNGQLVSRVREQNRYDLLGRKVGHTRIVDALVPDLASGSLALLQIEDENCSITYGSHPLRPLQMIQTAMVQQRRGMIYVDSENRYLNQPFRLPYLEAHRSGQVQIGANTTTEYGPIETIIERLRVRRDGEVDIQRTIIDHVASTISTTYSDARPGDALLARATNMRSVLLRNQQSGGPVETINLGLMPYQLALEVARRRLQRLTSSRRALRIQLPGYDERIRRGLLVRARDRAGTIGTFIVTGYAVRGSGGRAFAVRQTVDLVEVEVA
jgi:hypothetical protein